MSNTYTRLSLLSRNSVSGLKKNAPPFLPAIEPEACLLAFPVEKQDISCRVWPLGTLGTWMSHRLANANARVCVWGCVCSCRTRQAVVSRTPVCFTTHSNVLPFPLSRLYNSDPSSLRHLNICIIPAFQATSPNMGMRKPLSWAKTLSRFSMIDILYQYRMELVAFTS